MQPTLPVDRDHDLPPRWDGAEVEWQGWCDQPVLLCWRGPAERDVCPACGSTERRVMNRGLLRVWRRTSTGLRARRLGSIFAFRCPDCRHDQVLDGLDGEMWDLDESDYHDEGSVAP